MHLHVHLPNGQRIYFNEKNMREKLANPPKTTLTAFFDLCSKDIFAQGLFYNEVPQYFTFDNKKRVFNRRKNGALVDGFPEIRKSDMIGRVYTVQWNRVHRRTRRYRKNISFELDSCKNKKQKKIALAVASSGTLIFDF